MKLFRIITLTVLLPGCATMYGFTGSDEGKRVGDSMEYHVTHPGLNITIVEPYSENLIPIETVSKSSPSPMVHTVKFGTADNFHQLKIVGKYEKDLYLDGVSYGSVWSADVVVKNGHLFIDGVSANRSEN